MWRLGSLSNEAFYAKPLEETKEENFHYGKFSFPDLRKGQGLTLANSLRRVLLADIPGITLTSFHLSVLTAELGESGKTEIRQSGLHEFSTIPGMRESVLELESNFQEIVWGFVGLPREKKPETTPQNPPLPHLSQDRNFSTTVNVEAQSNSLDVNASFPLSGIVSINSTDIQKWFMDENLNETKNDEHLPLSDIPFPFILKAKHVFSSAPDVVKNLLVFPEHALATLSCKILKNKDTDSQFLEVQTQIPHLQIEYGLDIRNSHSLDIQSFFFLPVKKVNYSIQSMNNEKDDENVFLEIWTNGAMHPSKALLMAFEILFRLFETNKAIYF